MIHIALLLHSGDPGPGVCQGPNRLLYVWDPGTMMYRFIDNVPIKDIYYIGFLHHPYTCISMGFFEYIHIFICIHVALNLPSLFSLLNNTMSRRFQTQDYDMISYSKISVKAATFFWHILDLHPYLPRLPRSTPHAS